VAIRLIDGLGNHGPGGGRLSTATISGDALHPGRFCAVMRQENRRTEVKIVESLRAALSQ